MWQNVHRCRNQHKFFTSLDSPQAVTIRAPAHLGSYERASLCDLVYFALVPRAICAHAVTDKAMLARALPIRAIAVLGFETFVFALFATVAAAALGLS